ncbi:MAG: DUF1738 domain-containing protein [Lachnospiraceae bacterium]|nr:DUF1738 domain-containing protein [Lachnospiraceae bacterium]
MSAFDKVMEERKKLVEQIIANMRQGYVMPKEKWDRSMSMHIVNPVSHAKYRGINFVRLYLSMIENGYQDGRWMTYKQAESQGWQVRKGEHGVRLEKYIFERTVEEENPDTGKMEKVTKRLKTPMVNQFVVFNGSQIDGIPKLEELPPIEHDEILQIAEDVIASSDCPIVETMEGRAYYSPLLDEIHLPVRDLFIDQKSFLATTMHEMVHSTGHSSRLDRDLSGFFGSESYAREELRAELGAFFLEHDLGIQLEGQHFNSHTHYLQSWISVLEKDPNELFRAITDSQKATTYITDRYQIYLTQKEVVRDEQLPVIDLSGQEQPIPLPNIVCEWSESPAFEDGKVYSVKEFDAIMAREDAKYCNLSKEMLDKYGDYDTWMESGEHLEATGYDKVKFTVNFKDGSSITERQDIGDGDGGVIDFLSGIHSYSDKMPELISAVNDPVVVRDEQHNMELLLSELYPLDMRENEAAAIRISVKMEQQKPGHGSEYMKNWLQAQCRKENTYMDSQRADLLLQSFDLVKTISATGMLEGYYHRSNGFPGAKNTIEAVFGHDGSGFKYDAALKDGKPAPVMSCAM